MFNRIPLQNAFNEESFLTLYRDHSSTNYWCAPVFSSDDLYFLQNELPTFIFSIGCLTNDYYTNYASLIEAFCSHQPGAIGAIGAASVTYSKYNDLIFWGMFDHIWPTYMPTLGSHSEAEFAHPAYALVAGKIFLNQQTFRPHWTEGIHSTENLWGYTGETYLSLFSETPRSISAEINPLHINDQWRYHFTVEEGAKVCFTKGDEILQVVTATGHDQSIVLPHMALGDEITVTATKRNCLRQQCKVAIRPYNQAYISLKETICNDQNGNGQIDIEEPVGIDIVLRNENSLASEGGTLTLSCDSPYVQIMQGTAHYPHINPEGECTVRNAFKIRVAYNTPDQTDITLNVQFDEGENLHTDHIKITVNAPGIKFGRDINFTNSEGKLASHIEPEATSFISFSINNIGHSVSLPLSATLSINAPFVSVAAPVFNEVVDINETLDLTFELNATENPVTEAWLPARVELQCGNRHIVFDTIVPFGGIRENFETDTLNPFFIWTNSGQHPWEYCTNDAFEGERCFVSTADTSLHSQLRARLREQLLDHDAKLSFYYKTAPDESLTYYGRNIGESMSFSSTEWQYAEVDIKWRENQFNWVFNKEQAGSGQVKIDDICFPPRHNAVVYAGDDIITCDAAAVTLNEAYAFDYQSAFWTTDGDGRFEDANDINTNYIFSVQDLANSTVALTLHALNGTDTLSSTTHVTRLADFSFGGNIVGDSIVNKYENQISHYSIDYQEGARYIWQLELASAGYIYGQGETVDIVWNSYEGDAEVTLSVIDGNGCNTEPVSKTISLIGYSTNEWTLPNFELFPNPTDGQVNLVVDYNLQSKAYVEVFNLLGERMMRKNIGQLQKGQTLSVDLAKLASGLYIIKLSTENGSCSKKVSVK